MKGRGFWIGPLSESPFRSDVVLERFTLPAAYADAPRLDKTGSITEVERLTFIAADTHPYLTRRIPHLPHK